MSSDDTKILEFNQHQKSDKAPFINYANLECFIEKTNECKNNPQNSFITIVSKHIPSGFPMSIIFSFKSIQIKHGVYRGKDCMKKICESLRQYAINIINLKKKRNYQQKSSRNHMKMQKSVIFVKKNLKDKKYLKLEIIDIMQENIEVLRM